MQYVRSSLFLLFLGLIACGSETTPDRAVDGLVTTVGTGAEPGRRYTDLCAGSGTNSDECNDATSREECDACVKAHPPKAVNDSIAPKVFAAPTKALVAASCRGFRSCSAAPSLAACVRMYGCEFTSFYGSFTCSAWPLSECGGRDACVCELFRDEGTCNGQYGCYWHKPPTCSSNQNKCLNDGSYTACQPDGVMRTISCSSSTACRYSGSSTQCTASAGIPEGIFRNTGDAILYSNGNKHYCVYRDMPDYRCLSGNKGWDEINKARRYNLGEWPGMIRDGDCWSDRCRYIPKGVFYQGGTVYHSEGNGHYCGFNTMDMYKCVMSDPTARLIAKSKEYNLSAWPYMIDDGICSSERCRVIPEGVFGDGGPGVLYSNGQGHYCGFTTMESYKCITGDVLAKRIAAAQTYTMIAWPEMVSDGVCSAPGCP
jgi:hypothetical protein